MRPKFFTAKRFAGHDFLWAVLAGFPHTFDNWIQGLFKDFQGKQQQFSRIYFKARLLLPPLLAIGSSDKILYCHMILTCHKLITTMLVNPS